MGQTGRGTGFRLSEGAFFMLAVFIFGLVTLIITLISAWFMQNVWMVGDTKLFYRMAEVITSGGTPYIDFKDPKPPLIFFTLAIPAMAGQKLYGGLLLVGLCNLLSALVTMQMANKLYGRLPGFLAGLVFLVNMALAEGFFILTEPFTVLFILLSVYALLFTERNYLWSGALAGVAIGFKQYALLAIPLALFFLYRNKELKGALPFLAGLILPLLAIFGAIFLAYGASAGISSLYWSFGVADSYFTQGYIGDIPAYMAPSPSMALANVLLETGLFASLLAVTSASVLLDRPKSRHEEFFLLAGIAFLSLLFVRQYLHYWALALPFIILLCARSYRRRAPAALERINARGNGLYPAMAILFFAIAIAAFLSIEYVLMEGLWRPFDILSYYGLADPTAKMILGVVDGETGMPPLLFSMDLPASLPWGLFAVGFLVLASALIVMKTGIRSYGMPAGLLAGVLFTITIVWALGYLVVTDALMLALVLLSAYLATDASSGMKHFASGICAGTAACLGLFALILLPISAFFAWKRRGPGDVPALLVGALIPLVVAASLDFTLHGSMIHGLSLDSGLAFVGISISGSPYHTTDAIMAIANIVLAVCLFTALVPMALARFAAVKRHAAADGYFLIAGIGFIASIFLKEYLHYWFIALPFMALLCASAFGAGAKGDDRVKEQEAIVLRRAYVAGDRTVRFK